MTSDFPAGKSRLRKESREPKSWTSCSLRPVPRPAAMSNRWSLRFHHISQYCERHFSQLLCRRTRWSSHQGGFSWIARRCKHTPNIWSSITGVLMRKIELLLHRNASVPCPIKLLHNSMRDIVSCIYTIFFILAIDTVFILQVSKWS